MTIDRETIGAFVDGELNEIERRRIEAALNADPALAQQVEAERRLRAALKARFDPVAAAPVPEHLVAAVREGAKVAPMRRRIGWGMPQWAAMAATLALGLLVGQQLRPGADVVGRDGAMHASGALAQALETQLASAQGAPVRIGLTFKARDGAWCRTFEQQALAGIACRAGEGWALRRVEAGARQSGEYRQAGSTGIAAAAQDMAADSPLDAQAERAVIARAWQ